MPGAHDVVEDLLRRRVHVDGDDVGARHHDLMHLLVAEREDRMDHVALLHVEHALLFPGLDDRLDVLLADERALLRVRAERRRHDAGKEEEHGHERPREPGDELEREDHQQEHLLRVACADRSRDE